MEELHVWPQSASPIFFRIYGLKDPRDGLIKYVGRTRKMGPFRITKNSHPGDTLTGRARVTGKEVQDGAGLVQLEIGIDNQRGEAARGNVTVSLPV